MKISIGKYILLMVFTIISSSCTSSDSEKFTNKIIPIPPGTAQICGTIVDVKDTSDFLLVSVQVDTVFNYGQSTPPLVIGKNLVTNIPKNLIADSSQIDRLLDSKRLVYLELKHQNILSLGNKGQSKWSVLKMTLNKIFKQTGE